MSTPQIAVQGVDPRSGQPVGPPVPVTGASELNRVLVAAAAAASPFGVSRPAVRTGCCGRWPTGSTSGPPSWLRWPSRRAGCRWPG